MGQGSCFSQLRKRGNQGAAAHDDPRLVTVGQQRRSAEQLLDVGRTRPVDTLCQGGEVELLQRTPAGSQMSLGGYVGP